jgi:hypothetical protein
MCYISVDAAGCNTATKQILQKVPNKLAPYPNYHFQLLQMFPHCIMICSRCYQSISALVLHMVASVIV